MTAHNQVSPGNPVMVLGRTNYGDQPDQRGRHGVVQHHWIWCPGCDAAHGPETRLPGTPADFGGPLWTWDGNMTAPTFSPSLLCYSSVHLCPPDYDHGAVCPNPDSCGATGHRVLEEGPPRVLGHGTPHVVDPAWGNCHSFIRDGHWEFLGDCAHQLAGQTVPMVPLPDWLVR
jgi:hypothetical protein